MSIRTNDKSSANMTTLTRKHTENQAKFCQNRVAQAERHLGLFCETFSSMTRKSARMRDKGDLLARLMQEFAKTEDISHFTKAGCLTFAENLSAIQDYREAAIQRMQTKVVQPLSDYGNICRQVKAGIKSEFNAIRKEQKSVQQLQKVRTKNPSDAHQITRAQTEVDKASADANIGIQALEKQMDLFEQNKLKDLKEILTDFVNIEMVFHAKALEFYSKCFENVVLIDESKDLEEFRKRLRLSRGVSAEDYNQLGTSTLGAGTGTSSDFSNTMASGSLTSPDSTERFDDSSKPQRNVRINTSNMYGDEDDDEDDEDDDDEDDDDDDDDEDLSTRR